MRYIALIAVLTAVLLAIAPSAYACQGCVMPPPYTAWECGDVDCGSDGCVSTSYSNGSSYCAGSGNRCVINLLWCANRQQDPPPTDPKWARAKTPFEQRWQLVGVRVTHTKAKGRRA